MNFYIVLFFIFLFILFVYITYHLYIYLITDGRYKLYKLRPFPKEWEKYLTQSFPVYNRLPLSIKRNLQACIMVFVKEKEYKGVGITIDAYKKVLVAANACLLTAGRDRCEYQHVRTVYLYPATILKREKIQEGFIAKEEHQALLGEAWQGGEVVLSWRDLVAGDANPNDGRNVGFHEFAHQLDMEDGYADGVPELPWRLYPLWSKVMRQEYTKIKRLYEEGKRSVLDAYATTSPAEFFAVATEAFFEKPKRLKKEEPELYELLKTFYRLDPASWS